MKKNLTMQLLPLWLLAFFFFASVPIKAQTTPKASITKLIGCLPAPDADKAEVKITVDQDKVTDYTYNFNGTYTTNNVGKLTKGAKTILVKKTAGGQVYSVNINIPDKTATPTFTPVITYNCNGTADVRLTNNQGTYNYTYTYGGNTHNSPYFRDLAVGQHTVTVKYTPPVTTEKRVVFYDDFGTYNGETAKSSFSPYVNRNVFFDPLDGSGVQRRPVDNATRTAGIGTDSAYCIARRDDVLNGIPTVDLPNPIPTWLIPEDKDKEVNGKFLWYNVEHSVGDKFIVYQRKATVKANAFFDFRASVYNPVYEHATVNTYVDMKPVMQLLVYKTEADAAANVNVLYESYSLNVPKATKKDDWYTLDVSGHTGTNTELVFVIRMFNITLGPNRAIGNDVAIDNILVTQPSDSCEQTISVPVNVVTDTKTFSTTVVYNCAASTGNITITPTVTIGYEYTYSLDGSAPQTSNTFNNAAIGVHTLTITYKNSGAKTLFKEDFGSGASYSLPRSVVPEPFVYRPDGAGYPGDVLQEGDYRVANHDNLIWMPSWGWKPVKSHGDNSNTGRFLAFNYGPNANKTFYQQDIQVEPNKLVTLEYYALNIDAPSNLPNIRAAFINKATNATITTYDSGALPGRTSATYSPNDWQKITHTFNPGNATTIQLRFTNLNNNIGSNDFAIDDILVTQAYDTCTTTLTATVAPKVTQAFAGVTRLIGCGTGANANKAEVTITNVQGGTGAYEYNFDGTWVATNTGWLAAGTHTVSVRAVGTGNSCQYDMSVTVLAAIAQPTIKTAVHYACDGKAILNIGVENPDPELTYMYSLDGGAYTTTYVYTNVASGTHSISVQYEHRSVPSPSLLFREDFGTGTPTALPGPASDYGLTYGTTYPIGGGSYQIVSQAQAPSYWKLLTPFGTCVKGNPAGIDKRWVSVYDHTSGGTDPTGRFYMSDFKGTQADGDLFYKREVNVLPGADINYEFYALNLFREDSTEDPGKPGKHALKPNVVVRLVAPNGTVVASTTTGEIPNSVCATNLADNLKNWRKYEGKLNVGTYTKLTVEIRSVGSALHGWGNDMALDDITVNMIPKSCGQVISATKVVTANAHDIPAFTVSKTYDCATGKGTLTVTPTATTGFTYTYTLGSTTYTSTTATFTALDLEQTYTVSVSYQAVSNTITLLNEDFGEGTDAVKSPYVGKNLYFNENKLSAYTAYNGNKQSINHLANTPLMAGEYTIASNMVKPSYDWVVPADRSGKANGRKLFIDGTVSVPEQEVYAREVSIAPNLPLTFTTDFYNLVHNPLVPPANNPRVNIALYESEASYKNGSGALAQSTIEELLSVGNQWKTHTLTLTAANVGARTRIYAVVKMHNVIDAGHDLTIDNIVITQKLPACTTSVTATLTKGDVATPTLTLPANLSVICSAPTASATISSWIASATATSTCGTATVTHNYSYPSNLCNVTGGAVTVTFRTTDPFGNVVTATRVISFATMTLIVTPTTLSVPNGALGGTTSSVVPNITLGGVASPSTNSVTISFSGLPAGVTTNTNGQLVIPAGTPATSTLVTYRVCEKLNPTNCQTVTSTLVIGTVRLTVTPLMPLTVPHGISGVITSRVLTGVRLIGNVVTNTNSVTISFSGLPAGVTTDTQGRIVIPAGTPATSTLVTYKVCEKLNPTNCQTVTSTLVIGTGSLTVTPVTPLTVPNGISGGTTSSVLTGVRLNGNVVTNTNSVTITFSGLPAGVTTDTQGRIVVPAGTPATSTLVTYKVCEKLNPTNCQTVTSTLVIGTGSLTVTPVTPLTVPNGISGGTTSSVLTGITLNGTTVTNTNSVTISFSGLPTGVTTDTQGRIVVPAGTPATSTLVTYKVCEKLNPTNCQTVTSTLVIGTGSLTVTPVTPLTVPNGISGGTTSSVLTGVRLNGNVVTNTNSVTISFSGLPAGVTTDTQGRIVIPAGTPATSTLVTYKVCEKLNPTNCQTVTSTLVIGTGSLTVTPVTPLTVPNGISGGTTSSVLTGVRLNGNVVTNTNSVTITFSGLPAGVTTDTQGRIVIPAGTPATSTLVTYKVCEKLNPTNCQTVTSTLVIGTGSLTVTPVTPLTVPNGITGGTTSSVLTGVRLNGNVVTNTNSVTISFSGLPAGVTTDTQGRIVVPAGTPATSTLVTYKVCEKLNPTNCQTVTSTLVIGTGSLTVTPVTPLTVPNGISGGTTSSVLTGITLNGTTVTNTNSVTISFSGLPTGVTSNTNGQLVIPAGTPAGTHTITYRVCEKLNPTNCHIVTSTLVIGTGSLTVTPVTPLTVPNGISGGTTSSVLTGITLNGTTVTNTNSVTISFSGLPTGVTSNTNGQLVIPAGTPAGTHTITYKVCEKLNPTNCQTVTSTLVIGTGSLTVTSTTLTHPNGTQGGTTTGTVLTGVKINGNPVNTASVTITWNSLPPNATGNASGTVTIAPNTPAGTYTISYTVCERLNGNSNCQSVTSQITIGGGSLTATPTNLIVANGATGGTSVNNVLTGVKINGNPVNTNSVTITWNSLPPGFTGTNSGTVTVPVNTPAGIYTVTYTVCERLNSNSNCKTVSSTITVGNGSMVVVPTPITVPNGTIGGTSTPSVLTGVVLNGNSNPAPNTVSITWNTLPPRATGNNDGTVNVAPNTPAGTYTVSYTICEALNSSHCTTVTSSITIGGGVLTVTPVTTLTVANGAQGGTTTSSVLTGVSLNGQPASSQSVTITFSGLPAGVTSNTNGQLVVAPGTPATNTTIYYTVCETLNANNNCHTYSTTLVIGTPNLSVTPRTYAIPDATVGGTTSSVLETVTIDGHTPSSQSVTITFGNLPVGIQTTTSGGFRVPAGTPTGIHIVTYTVCEVLNPDHCVTSIATIAVGNVPVVTPNAFTYTGTATVTTPSILDDDTVGTQSATTGTGGNVVINITSTPTGTVVPSLDANNGRVTIPAGTPPGIYTITYDVCTTATPTACTPGVVVITIPNVPVITPDDMVYTDTTTTTAGNILTNDRVGTQSATAGNGGNVSITVTIPATPKAPGATVPTLNPNTGVVTVPAGTPSGTYTITYKICTTATPTSCDTGVVTITVSGTVTEAPDTNDVTAYTRINTPVTVGVTSSTTVTVSIPSQPANGTAVSNGDGTITYTPNNGFKGTDSFEYSLCNAAGCRTATINVRVTSELIIYNGVSIGGSDKNNYFHIEGIENYPNNTVRIYNRWGVKVFEMSGYNNTTKAFKGVSDARATLEASDNLPQGTYYYIIEYVDEHNKTQTETGWLYLKKN